MIGKSAVKLWAKIGMVAAAINLSMMPLPVRAEDDPTKCEATASWGDIEGRSPTIMILRQNQQQFDDGDSIIIAFFNDDWSISNGDKLGRIKLENEDGGWLDNDAIALDHGFIIWSEFKHLENVFGGVPQAMFVSRDGKTIDNLRLSGFFSDWMEFRSCRSKKVAVKDERERKSKLERAIPKDPFRE